MAKQHLPKPDQILEKQPSLRDPKKQFQEQLKSLLVQQKYRQALESIDKMRRSDPNLTFTPSEAEIWLLKGKQEFEKADFKTAEHSLRRSL